MLFVPVTESRQKALHPMKVGEAQSGEAGGGERGAGAAQRERRPGEYSRTRLLTHTHTSTLAFRAFSAENDWFASLSDLCS